jgi:hypothetical protein
LGDNLSFSWLVGVHVGVWAVLVKHGRGVPVDIGVVLMRGDGNASLGRNSIKLILD